MRRIEALHGDVNLGCRKKGGDETGMEFKLDQQTRLIRDPLREFLKKEIAPREEEYQTERKYISKSIVKNWNPTA